MKMNKFALLCLGFVILLTGSVLATDVAYITKSASYVDDVLTDAMNNADVTYEIIDDSDISSTDFSEYGLVLVDYYFPAAVNVVQNNPSVIMHPNYYATWADEIGSIVSSQPLKAYTNPNSPIADGVPDHFSVYTQCCSSPGGPGIPMYYIWGRKIGNPQMVVRTESTSSEFVLATKEDQKRVFFGITETNYWTADSEKLFLNSINWILEDQDNDGDGYAGSEDCDDNDPEIYPGAPEIPYDGIDQDCDGYDSADVDDDGYAYPQDCDDTDDEIYPGAEELLDDIDQNCVNDAPILLENIPDFVWDEDSVSTIVDLDDYFADPDGDDLIYDVYDTSTNPYVYILLNGNLISFLSEENWFGEDWIIFEASDGEATEITNLIDLIVNSVNDAPILENIEDVDVDEGILITITAVASDVDNTDLEYEINDERFTQADNVFTWQTEVGDEGIYYALVSVSDGDLVDSQQIKITIEDNNLPPVFEPLADILVQEDSGFTNDINVVVTDSDGYVNGVEIIGEDLNEVDCTESDLKLGVEPAEDFYGTATCTLRATDNLGKYADYTFNIIVSNVNDAPVIDFYSPDWNPKIPEDGIQNFEMDWNDIDNTEAEVLVSWFVDGNPVSVMIAEEYDLNANDFSLGEHEVKVVVSDLETSVSQEWDLVTSDKPITEKYGGETTDFSGMDDDDLQCVDLILEKTEYGKIKFLECIDMRNVVDLDKYTDISSRMAGVDSNFYPSFKDKLAEITFYNVDEVTTPSIYYTSAFTLNSAQVTQVCSDDKCSEKDYNVLTKIFKFLASSFSTFRVGSPLTCSQQQGEICNGNYICSGVEAGASDGTCCLGTCMPDFSEMDVCEVVNDNLTVEIKDPDEGEKFEAGEVIEGKIKIGNDYEDDQDFEVEVYLYDLSGDEEVEEFEGDVEVDESEDEYFEFELEIPEDLEEGDYYIFVKVEDDVCNQNYLGIEIEAKEHNVVIEDVELNFEEGSPGESIEVKVKVENLGTRDEDVKIVVDNSELGIHVETEEFELDEDDSERKTLSFFVPENTENKKYELDVKVIFDDREDSEKIWFEVVDESELDSSSGSSGSGIYYGDLINLGQSLLTGSPISLNSGKTSGDSFLNLGSSGEDKEIYEPTLSVTLSNGKKSMKGEGNLFVRFSETFFDFDSLENCKGGNCFDFRYLIIIFAVGILIVLLLILFLRRRH